MTVHLIKLCVGAASLEDLADWQAGRIRETGAPPVHVTRMWPRRADEILAGGSLYWVIRGVVLCRQRVRALEPRLGEDGVTRCAIGLDPVLVRVRPQPRRPFQGWRYLAGQDAPPDLAPGSREGEALPPALEAELAEIGVF
jgi:hypothetical protein